MSSKPQRHINPDEQALNDQFVLIKQSNKLSLEREAALQKLDLAFKNFYELEGNFKEGIQVVFQYGYFG